MALVDRSGFLKCAFAPNDFATTGFVGVPDQYSGLVYSAAMEHVETISLAPGQTKYLLLAPSVGVAYIESSSLTGIWQNHKYATFDDMISYVSNPAGEVADQVHFSQFRYVSQTLELTNTTPLLSRGGVIKVQDVPLRYAAAINQSSDYVIAKVNGLPATMTRKVYADDASHGVYTVAVNQEEEFDWFTPLTGVQYDLTLDFGEHGAVLEAHAPGGSWATWAMKGWDNGFGSKLVQITAPDGQGQTFEIKTTACVEFRPEPDTLLAAVAHSSPQYNAVEMAIYHRLASRLPIAVRRADNAGFWEWVRKTAAAVFTGLSILPGPYGIAAAGLATTIGALDVALS